MAIQKPHETVENEFEQFGRGNPPFVQTLSLLSDIGARLNTDLANTLATLAYVQKTKATLKEKVNAYEVVLQALLDVSANLASHGVALSNVLVFIVSHADDINASFRKSGQPSLEKYLLGLTVQKHIKEENND